MKPVRAWHFTGPKLRNNDPIPPVGEWLIWNGPVKMCESGLHASRDPFDALKYAPGPTLHLVECAEIVEKQSDKFVCRRRKIIASKDATEGLLYYARAQAISVIDLWDAPDIVCDYLMTGDPVAWSVAWSAAESAAWSAAESAAESAAWSAAWSAARLAAESAAWSAAESAARSAAWSAARKNFNEMVTEAFEEWL